MTGVSLASTQLCFAEWKSDRTLSLEPAQWSPTPSRRASWSPGNPVPGYCNHRGVHGETPSRNDRPPGTLSPLRQAVNVLYVNNQVRLGGAETVIRQLLRGFPKAQLVVAEGKTFPRHVQPLYPRLLARLFHSRAHNLVERVASRARWTDRAFRRLASGPHDLIHLHNFHGQ